MAHHTEQTGFPDIHLSPGMQLRLVAQNPTTDAEVADVTCTRWSIYGYDKSPGPPLAEELPSWVPESADEV